jgi:hypothetical protein
MRLTPPTGSRVRCPGTGRAMTIPETIPVNGPAGLNRFTQFLRDNAYRE